LTLAGDTLPEALNVIQVTPRVANEIVKGTGLVLSAFDEQVMKSMKPASKEIKEKTAFLQTTVKTKIVQTRNVLGVIEGENPDEVIVVGGHFDHMGKVQGYIYNGADDNGSGTIGMLTIAKACAATGVKPKRTIVFAGWTGEEQGLLGSQYFVQHPFKPLKNILFDVNYDMIGRNSTQDSAGNQVGMTYTESVPMFKDLNERMNNEYNIGLVLNIRSNPRPGGGSDHASFSAKDIPVMSWMAAMHAEYHQPGDQVEKINFEKMTKIIRLGFLDVWELANSDKKVGVTP
jgi:Zn-dependent M28 family amino/carboxypeptidase